MRGRSWSTGPAGAEVEVADLAVAHLAVGQADGRAGRLEAAVRPAARAGRASAASRAAAMASAAGSRPEAEAVDDDEDERARARAVDPLRRSPAGSARRRALARQPRPATRAGGEAGARHDAGHLVDLQAGAADERPVDGRLGEELADRGARHASRRRARAGPRPARRSPELGAAWRGWRPPSPRRRRRWRSGRCRWPRRARRRRPGRPGRRARRATTTSSAPSSWSRTVPRPRGRPRAPRAARRRRGSAGGRPRRSAASLRPMSSSVSPWSRRRSEWPTMHQVARPDEHRGGDLAGVGARGSAWTFWAPTATSVPVEGVAHGRERHEGRADDAHDVGHRAVAAAMARPAARRPPGVVFIFQLPAMMTGRMRPIIGAAGPCCRAGGRRARAACEGRAATARPRLDAQARCAQLAEAWPPARPGARSAAHGAARRRGSVGQRGRSPRAPRWRRSWRRSRRTVALEVGGLGVEDAIEMAVQLARDEPRLELEDARRRAARAQEREDRLGALPGHDAAAAAHAPAAGKPDVGQARGERAAPRRAARRARGARARRPRLSEPAARNRPRSQADAAVRRAPRPSRSPAAPAGAGSLIGRRRSAEAHREPRPRPASGLGPRAAAPRPGALGGAAAGPRRVDGRQLGAHRLRRGRGRAAPGGHAAARLRRCARRTAGPCRRRAPRAGA